MRASTSWSVKAGWPTWPTLRLAYVGQVPRRMHERPFWLIQTLMVAITGLHYLMEQAWLSEAANVHHIPVTLYLIAVVYAGLFYGFEGGLLTAVEAVALSMPSILLNHYEGYAWIADSMALIAVMGTGAVVAWLVEEEAGQRRRAEATGRRFALLHDVGSTVTQTLELEGVLQDAVRGVARALNSDRAWISVWESPDDPPKLRSQIGEPITLGNSAHDQQLVWEAASRQVQGHETAVNISNVAIAVPLAVEGRVLGALGTASRVTHAFSLEDIDLLAAMGNQVAIAIENARLYRDERSMRQALRDYARRITQAQEEERKRIARELHDDIVQRLVLISRDLDDLLEAAQSGSPCGSSQLAAIRAATRESAQAVRRFSRDLRPSVLDDLGLAPAIDWLINDLHERTGIEVSLEVTGTACRLPSQIELQLFRVAQESLHNVERHAQAATASVTLQYEPASVCMVVRDDGCGMAASRPSSECLGILGMEERVKLLGGTFAIHSEPDKGVQVSCVIPVEPATPLLDTSEG